MDVKVFLPGGNVETHTAIGSATFGDSGDRLVLWPLRGSPIHIAHEWIRFEVVRVNELPQEAPRLEPGGRQIRVRD
jgi:hypothetical protein